MVNLWGWFFVSDEVSKIRSRVLSKNVFTLTKTVTILFVWTRKFCSRFSRLRRSKRARISSFMNKQYSNYYFWKFSWFLMILYFVLSRFDTYVEMISKVLVWFTKKLVSNFQTDMILFFFGYAAVNTQFFIFNLSDQKGLSGLSYAIKHEQDDVISRLLEEKKIILTDSLHCAVDAENHSAVLSLLKRGADPNQVRFPIIMCINTSDGSFPFLSM